MLAVYRVQRALQDLGEKVKREAYQEVASWARMARKAKQASHRILASFLGLQHRELELGQSCVEEQQREEQQS